MEKDRSLENALNDKTTSKEKEKRIVELQLNEDNPIKDEPKPRKEDIVDKLLRGIIAIFLAVYISTVVAGFWKWYKIGRFHSAACQ